MFSHKCFVCDKEEPEVDSFFYDKDGFRVYMHDTCAFTPDQFLKFLDMKRKYDETERKD